MMSENREYKMPCGCTVFVYYPSWQLGGSYLCEIHQAVFKRFLELKTGGFELDSPNMEKFKTVLEGLK